MSYDVLIVGSGPAGMFAANRLAGEGLKVLVIDKGRAVEARRCPMESTGHCSQCNPCDILCGVGGSGTFSDGILNLRTDVGGNLLDYTTEGEARALLEEVDGVFMSYGAPSECRIPNSKEVERLKRRAASVGAAFIEITQRHIGSDFAPELIRIFSEDLKRRGVEFLLNVEVADLLLSDGACHGVALANGEVLLSKSTILAPGRVGCSWVESMVRKYRISGSYGPIDVGVRVEVSNVVMEPVIRVNRDPKFHIRTRQYDDFVRTFCTNSRGYVVQERYKDFIGVNGHSYRNKESDNTNFAFLVQVNLTEPVENTLQYGESIARLATTIGGGKPLIQRLGDLRNGKRSTPERILRSPVRNTLEDVTPGDVSMALPHRIVVDILEGMEVLDRIIPGVASDFNLLYAPEIKFYSMRLDVTKDMETNFKGLFAAGDGVGLSRDLVNASATGILAARGVLHSKEK